MNAPNDLIDQLEGALADKDLARRADVLRRVTDLFVLGSGQFSEDQVALFDEVMTRLVEKIEVDARAQFGNRLASLPDAPPRVVHDLASDDDIAVAGPVLTHCERLDESALLENARTKSQDHLMAISRRKVLVETVTDILVERGNRAVVVCTAANDGARFSDAGVSTLVRKAGGDGDLALRLWSRPDIPRQNLVKLFVDASEAIRDQLAAADPRKAASIRTAVAEASDQIQREARSQSGEFAQARALVAALHAAGKLDEATLKEFAAAGSFDKVTAALALMCDLPIGLVERVLVQNRTEQTLVIAKAIDLTWDTTMALLLQQAGAGGGSRSQLDQGFVSFSRLQPKTARIALQFYRMREKANQASA